MCPTASWNGFTNDLAFISKTSGSSRRRRRRRRRSRWAPGGGDGRMFKNNATVRLGLENRHEWTLWAYCLGFDPQVDWKHETPQWVFTSGYWSFHIRLDAIRQAFYLYYSWLSSVKTQFILDVVLRKSLLLHFQNEDSDLWPTSWGTCQLCPAGTLSTRRPSLSSWVHTCRHTDDAQQQMNFNAP